MENCDMRKVKRKVLLIVAAVLLLIVIVTAIVALPIYLEYTRTESSDTAVTVEIKKGSSEKEIAQILKKAGVINYETSFRIKMYNSPYRGKLNYGKYKLYKEMCLDDLIRALASPSVISEGIKLTIPEGWSVEKIALECEAKGICTGEDFLNTIETGEFSYGFISDIPDKEGVKHKLEGYLFPSTYYFKENSSAYTVINTLLGEFEKQYDSIKSKKPENVSMNDIIIKAAMIEREAKIDSERPVIAGVIENRLRIGMPLQIDACVVYVISDGLYNVDRVLYKDLEAESPYNTYKYAGLPVGAICNPGLQSTQAAMEPEVHNYIYYHTDTDKNDGSHIFSETYSQHIR